MIENDHQLDVTRKRIEHFQQILTQIRRSATPENFDAMSSGYRLEIERMQAEVMDYLLRPISEEKQPA
jgi:hypothetical protein